MEEASNKKASHANGDDEADHEIRKRTHEMGIMSSSRRKIKIFLVLAGEH
jgi:hypothetical protein